MKYVLVCIIAFFFGCKCEHENEFMNSEIHGLWVISGESEFKEYIELAIIGDTIYFDMPDGIYRHELSMKGDSIYLFNHFNYFKVSRNKITIDYSLDSFEVVRVDLVRPTFKQLEIGSSARKWIYKINKSSLSDAEKVELIQKILDKAFFIPD